MLNLMNDYRTIKNARAGQFWPNLGYPRTKSAQDGCKTAVCQEKILKYLLGAIFCSPLCQEKILIFEVGFYLKIPLGIFLQTQSVYLHY